MPTVTPTPSPLVVVGSATVVSATVGMPGGNEYEGAVVFRVKNPNSTLAAENVSYRVSVMSGGKTVYTSDGTDRLSISPNAEHLIVHTFSNAANKLSKPDAATVQLYSHPTLFVLAENLPDASEW